MSERTYRATIKFTADDGADTDAVAEFIVNALESWGGSFRPEDPLFSSLEIKRLELRPHGGPTQIYEGPPSEG